MTDRSVLRLEDARLMTVGGRYTDDLPAAGAAHVVFVRSPVAHGRLRGVDVTAARRAAGVLDVVTAADVDVPPVPPHPPVLAQQMPQPLLADGVVRFAGEAVAAVVARTRAEAVDAAALVVPAIDPRRPLLDPVEARTGAPLLHPEAGTNVALSLTFARPVRGDVLAGCEVIVRERVRIPRLAACPLEPRAVLARWDGGRVELCAGTQGVHLWREQLAACLGLPLDAVRVVSPDVGGAFGSRAGPSVEDVLLAWLARRLDRPVRWCETRSENLLAHGHGRAQVQDIALGGTRDGRMEAYRLDVVQDAGAYPCLGAVLPFWTRTMLTGPYDLRRARFTACSVVTTTAPVVAYRGAGQPEAVAALERIVDRFAREIGMDPAEVRRRNLVRADAMPYTTVTRATYDSGDYRAALDRALATVGYADLRVEQARRRERADPWLPGIGMASFVKATGADTRPEFAAVEICPDGDVEVRTGTAPHGQGHETAWAALAAERLGVPVDAVRVRHGDTDLVPWGGGTGGSRSAQTGGVAVARAAELLAERARTLAAGVLGAGAVTPCPGGFAADGVRLSWRELVAAVGRESLRVEHTYQPTAPTYPYACHVAVVEVDTGTGLVRLRRFVAVDDAGRLVNPIVALGQVRGGLAQGVAQALYEELRYAPDGTLATGTLADYGVPSAADLPDWETQFTETPTPANELGVKGIGESGALGAPAAVLGAVLDALAPLGVTRLDTPLTPERVWRALTRSAAEPPSGTAPPPP